MRKRIHADVLAGVLMGSAAILLWSLSAACVVVVGKQLGLWQFLASAALISGLLQVAGFLALGRKLRTILMPPPKLWFAIALGFILYLNLYITGLVISRSATQAVGVSLMNYLWPTLAILFTTWLVPGERMHARLALAMALSLVGVLLAVGVDISRPNTDTTPWAYVLGGLAAVSWAAYCALISRWRCWARNYAAAPLGFIMVGILAAGVCFWRGEWEPMTRRIWMGLLLTAFGPWAGGYMLWEMALHRISGITLGLMGAATPVLSTSILIGLFIVTKVEHISGTRVVVLLVAATMIGVSVVVGRSSSVDRCALTGNHDAASGEPT